MKILIGIQARSGSTRLPRKAFELIAGKMLLDHVIDTCKIAAHFINQKNMGDATVAVLTPSGDPIVGEFSDRVNIVEGSHYDVLARYMSAVTKYAPDYLVRITGDCPMLPPFIISNFMDMAIRRGYDYVSNVDERFRTAIDGYDCEVISSRLFNEMANKAIDSYDREHVTPWLRKNTPKWARMGIALNNHDMSDIKLSVDTKDDLDRVRRAFEGAYSKHEAAKAFYKNGVHKL